MTNRATQWQPPAIQAGIGLFQSPSPESNIGRWRINGFPAKIIIWTDEEWENLTVRPDDAQYYPCGVWCALRVE
jgi:hypothetical protein